MGLTQESTKIKSLEDIFHIEKKDNFNNGCYIKSKNSNLK